MITNPCPPTTGYNIGKPTADVVTISHDDPDHSYVKAVAGKPVVVTKPGEYEISGAFITAITTYQDAEKTKKNLAFVMEMEGLRVCHLGNLGHTPSADQAEEMTGVDILLIPVGGGSTIDGAHAAEVASMLEAKIVIPMHFKTAALKNGLEPPDRFLKELGASAGEPQPKVSVNRSSVPSDTKVIMLDYKK